MRRGFLRTLAGLILSAAYLLSTPTALATGHANVHQRTAGLRIEPLSQQLASVFASASSQASYAISREVLEHSERLWNGRVFRGIVKDTLFLYTLEVNGETALERVGSGCIEENYYVRASDLSKIGISTRCRRAPNWNALGESEMAKHVGEGSHLRLRGYLARQDSKLYICWEITVTDETGTVVYYDYDQQPASKNEHYSFRVSTWGTAYAASNPQILEREWTYVSSDGRELWKVDLLGSFQDGQCMAASGFAQALSEDWVMEDSEFLALEAAAVAHVTVSRRVLGFVVARESYEFRMTTE